MIDTDKLIQAGEKLGEKIGDLATQYGPQATELAMTVARVSAAQTIVIGAASIGVCYAAFKIGNWCLGILKDDELNAGAFVGAIISACCFVGGAISVFANFLNAFAWIGLFHPEIYIAAKIMKL